MPSDRGAAEGLSLYEVGVVRIAAQVFKDGACKISQDDWKAVGPPMVGLKSWVGTATFLKVPGGRPRP
eukprot:5323172-Lingulodinium_polyedra.AAC.1